MPARVITPLSIGAPGREALNDEYVTFTKTQPNFILMASTIQQIRLVVQFACFTSHWHSPLTSPAPAGHGFHNLCPLKRLKYFDEWGMAGSKLQNGRGCFFILSYL